MTETESDMTSRDGITRRKGHGWISELVERWHRGPGEPGGRTYLVIYASNGHVRIDINEPCTSLVREVRLEPTEIRPAAEWTAHLKATGQKPTEPRWCVVDGMEIPQERIDREIPEEPEEFCSRECAREVSHEW